MAGQVAMALNWKRAGVGEIIYCEGGEALAQAAQGNCGCLISESVQDQAEWSSEQPGLVEYIPADGRGAGTSLNLRSFPSQTIA